MSFEIRLLDEAIDFINALNPKLSAKVLRTINLLEEFGYNLREPHSKKVTNTELFELRVILGTNICRLFYFHHKKRIYVITSGYIKKDKKLIKKELDKAILLMNEIKGE